MHARLLEKCFEKFFKIVSQGRKWVLKNPLPTSCSSSFHITWILTSPFARVVPTLIHWLGAPTLVHWVDSNVIFGFLWFSISFSKGAKHHHTLLLFLTEAYYANEKNNELYAFYPDFAKAFDTVPHHLFLTKLRHIGNGGNLLKLIHSYLIGRKQFEINGTSSTLRVIISGVPQGSILGPLLFIVFIDKLPSSCSESLMFLFADDCKSISSDLPALERDFHSCLRWAQENLMTFNLSKTNFIAFGKSSPGLSLNIENTAIPASNTVKDLGLTISSNLSWSSHIELKVKSAPRLNFSFLSVIN